METGSRIEKKSSVMRGQPVIANTRITVASVLHLLAEGKSHEQVIAEIPGITNEMILACLAYAAKTLSYKRSL